MDNIKKYAVSSKLLSGTTLLDYIVKGENVPIKVIEESFKPLLQDFDDKSAELIMNDYKAYLRDSVELSLKTHERNVFDVHGEVRDSVLDTIRLLHSVSNEEMITDIIETTFSNFPGGRSVVIDNLTFSKQAEELLEMVTSTKPIEIEAEHANSDEDKIVTSEKEANETVTAEKEANETVISEKEANETVTSEQAEQEAGEIVTAENEVDNTEVGQSEKEILLSEFDNDVFDILNGTDIDTDFIDDTENDDRLTAIYSNSNTDDDSHMYDKKNQENIERFKKLTKLSKEIYESLRKDLEDKQIKQRLAAGLSL